MKRQTLLTILWLILATLSASTAIGQDEEPALPSAEGADKATSAETEVPSSQEVEINEDNYRQFMELRDANRQRDIIPENVFKPGSGLQKLDKLPEESQKHLRNQLREIIVQGDPWQPGDEETEYPYTPSAAASTDPSLEKQEQEAWGELVGGYHERESQIYENSSGTQAAMGSEQGSNNAGNDPGSSGENGQSGEGSQGRQAVQEGNPDQSDTEGTYSLDGSTDSSANSTAGVSQNAMEFLQGLGKGGGGAANGTQGDSAENGPGGNSPTPAESESQAQTGQASSAGTGGAQRPPGSPNSSGTEGTSQNALEFLMQNGGSSENPGENSTGSTATTEAQVQAGESEEGQLTMQQVGQDEGKEIAKSEVAGNGQDEGQDDGQSQSGQLTRPPDQAAASVNPPDTSPVSSSQPEEESNVGASQNALEYLTGESSKGEEDIDAGPDPGQAEGTLSIQDLLNARGTDNAKRSTPVSIDPVEGQQADENLPDKDKDG